MPSITIEPKRLKGEITLPSDKSISHRTIIVGSLAQGETLVKNLSVCDDCLRTLNAFRSMGISITQDNNSFHMQGKGLNGLSRPQNELYLGNSATSMRLILGILAGQRFSCTLSGDASLNKRPMQRVIEPLGLMGAKISGSQKNKFAPLSIQGGNLLPISYETKVASAQVKSALLLAGLYAPGTTMVREPAKSRDHTERILSRFGADIFVDGLAVSVKGRANLVSNEVDVPGDISAASFFLVGACITKKSQVITKSVGLNPTRTAFLNILQKMGAAISWKYERTQSTGKDYDEAKGTVTANYSNLKGIIIKPEQIPALIDELPVLMVAATQSEGTTIIQGAGELRVKETDRISAMVTNLDRLGADIRSSQDDIIIRGPCVLSGSNVESFGDHRIAMSMAVAGLVARRPTKIKDAGCVDVSFPGFFETLSSLLH